MPKVAIVTGASRGIGAAIAKRLAADGIRVVVNYTSRPADAEQVVRDIARAGGQAYAVLADVSDPVAVEALFDQAEVEFGAVDILINNAGIIQPGMVNLADSDDGLYQRLFAINTKGTFNTLRLAATRLREGGRIVNFSSSAVALALPGYSLFAASKAAVECLTRVFAKELRGRSICVNAIAPGPTATDLFLSGKRVELVERLAKQAPLERLGSPADIANVVAFLVSEEGDWVNGQVIGVNGGLI
ncbi:SDR family oxidoreductase [Pseudomonas sp. LPB0260]|uniref:SDR family oxidoreductase n=1 Tax=unclassified Pseudomonas TaxID=196821 RepID=UPI0015C1EF13|nr:SDR family oxidoreductase [Pseudomonas sp. LPB0260]QLC72336.1 SDR family oxidoreductase [Pseudomonas sp. LPB0260]QLC75113.1 SDR family oxidoreductase [Pseudomonas sp. LPB0260]